MTALEIRPGRHLTRGGREVYITCRCAVTASGGVNDYPWCVSDGKSMWSVDDAGRHMKNGVSIFDVVSKVDAAMAKEQANANT